MEEIIAKIRKVLHDYHIEEIDSEYRNIFITLNRNPCLYYSDLKKIIKITGDDFTSVSSLDNERLFIITTVTGEKLKKNL